MYLFLQIAQIPIQFRVHEPRLVLHGGSGSKRDLLGFCDPRPPTLETPEPLLLTVEYVWQGWLYQKTCKDSTCLVLPSATATQLGAAIFLSSSADNTGGV